MTRVPIELSWTAKKGGKVSEGEKSRVTEDVSRLKKITLPDYVVN